MRVLAFCNIDAGVIDQLEIAKVLSYIGTKFVCQDGEAESSRVSTSLRRFGFKFHSPRYRSKSRAP